MEEWVVKARLRGGFQIVGQSALEGKAPMVPGLARIDLHPVFSMEGKPTGEHDLSAVLQVRKTPGEEISGIVITDRVTDLLGAVCSLFALGCGQRVQVVGQFSATMRISNDSDDFRQITGNPDYAELVPPVPLQQSLLTIAIDLKVRRIITWWSRGLPPGNAADRLISLNNALDMVANSKKLGKLRIVECANCKHRRELEPGLRENVLALLDAQGVPSKEAKEIYDARIALAHGLSHLSLEEERAYESHCGTLLRVIRDALVQDLGLQLPMPQVARFHGKSTLLDVRFKSQSLASNWREWQQGKSPK
jgi:hypothetical protein